MSDNTLAKKVEKAWTCCSGMAIYYPHVDMNPIHEALVALEDKVKELEQRRDYYMSLLPTDSPLIRDDDKEPK